MGRGRTHRRRLSLDRLGAVPRGRLRGALRPAVTLAEGLLGAAFVVAMVAVLDHTTLAQAVRGRASGEALQRLVGTLAVVGGLTALGLAYLARFQRRLVSTRRQLLVFGVCCLACVVAAKALLALDARLRPEWRSLVYLTPLSAFAVFFAVIYGQREAIAAGLILAMLVGLAVYATGPRAGAAAPEPLPVIAVLLSGALFGALASRTIRKRTKLLKIGLLAGLLHVGLLLSFHLLRGRLRLDQAPPFDLLWGLGNGVGVGMIMTILLPLIELVFDVATDIRLLELTDQDQPLLRSLVTLAPSTDNHSRRVARLAEAAAEAIGANSLLALVGAYYHDIGKMTKPECYIENQMDGENPHDRLRPSMSALVIASHVKDGVELAVEARLPHAVTDIIEQHHGTSSIEYFLDRYLKQAGDKATLDTAFFRYPGPKPATKEAAIVMIADAIEAASRTLDQPVPSRIEALVKRITASKLLDGQLEDCRLTLSEVRLIEQAIFRVLCAMYHARIEYPTSRLERPARPSSRRTT
ncbi:MAG TPA: HDIG domain-containing protein [Planctomycetota bacterium]|nr:HDIG domain-containing protein [Planctomycetota bacterium]